MTPDGPVSVLLNRRLSRLLRFLLDCLAAFALLVLPGLTTTYAEELPEKVREALQKGNEAVRQRQWILAGQQFKIATDGAETAPEVMLANARFSEQKGGSDLVAIAWYRAYLATQTDAKEREQIKSRIDALEQSADRTTKSLIDKALSAASNVPTNQRAGTLINIAVAQAKIGDLSGALATASSARAAAGTNYYGADPFASVANALAEMGNLAAAEDVLRRVDQSKRSEALRQIAWTLTYAKRFPEALSYAARASGSDQVTAYSSLAKAQADAGDRTAARSSLSTAINAINYLQENQRPGWRLNLVEAAAYAGEFETARQLYAEVSKSYKDDYYLNVARWNLAGGLVKWGRIAEAEAMVPGIFPNNKNPSFAWYKQNLVSSIRQARQQQAQKLKEKYLALVKDGKIAEADAALSREPPSLGPAIARLALASAYLEKGDKTSARRHLEPAAAVLSKTTLADFSDNAYEFALNRIAIADDYRAVGDLVAARRVLDATAGTISKLTNPSQRQYPISNLCDAYARLASATAATKNFAGAKAAAMEVFRLVAQSTPDERAAAFAKIDNLGAQVGLANELAAIVPSLPSGYSKRNIQAALVSDYIALGQDSSALAVAAQIEDVSTRRSTLSSAIAKRLGERNWTAAMALANDPAVSGRLYPEIASKMLAANMLQEAVALEPKFGASDEANSYFSSLAQYHANRGNLDGAVNAAMRISAAPNRISTLLSMVYYINSKDGRLAARSVLDRAMAQFTELKSQGEQASACYSINYYLRYDSFIDDDAPAKTTAYAPGPPCVAYALAIPTQDNRLSSLGNALSYSVTASRILGGLTAPVRPAISRLLAEASSLDNLSSRDSNLSNGFNALAREGAIETALDLAASSLTDTFGYAPTNAAVTWLVAAGDTTTAREILKRQAGLIAGIKESSSRDSARSRTVDLALLLEDFDQAIQLTTEMESPSNRVSAFVGIANSANSHRRFEVALNALDRAVAADKEVTAHYYRSSFYSIASQAGHKNVEAYLNDYLADPSVVATSRVSARGSVIYSLAGSKQYDRATALVPVQEADIALLGPADRWGYSATFATSLAMLGDAARINKLFADAPLPENRASILLSAAAGFKNAEKPDMVKAAVDRALELSAGIADQVTRSSMLQSIASWQVQFGNLDAARKTLAQSMEVLKIQRPDLAGWIEFNIASATTDSAKATSIALGIADPFWRTSAVVQRATNRFSANQVAEAVTLLRSLPPTALADPALETISRKLTSKHDFDPARELAARISHPVVRDQVRRYLVLTEARSDAVEAALADITTIEDKSVRAYTFIDLGAFLLTQKGEKAPQDRYFAQLSYFAATKLADQVADPLMQANILAEAGQGRNKWQAGAGGPVLANTASVVNKIPDARARQFALQWINGLTAGQAKKPPDQLMVDERGKQIYEAKYDLNSDQYLDLDAHLESFAASNPTDRISKLIYIATSFAEKLQTLRTITADFEKKRNITQ